MQVEWEKSDQEEYRNNSELERIESEYLQRS